MQQKSRRKPAFRVIRHDPLSPATEQLVMKPMNFHCSKLHYTRCPSAEFYPSSPCVLQSEFDANVGQSL